MKTIRTIAIALTLFVTLPAFAADGVDPDAKQLTVSYAGLDLGTQKGVATLYNRIRLAAQSVCRNLETLELGTRHTKWKNCINSAIVEAVADVNSPTLNSYASTKLGDALKPVAVAKSK